MQDYSIERAGIPNLVFTGELIGQSAGPDPRIKIYRTNGNKFVARQDAQLKLSRAEHFDTAQLLINWFKDVYGKIALDAEDAVEDAANHDDAFKAAWNVHVD